MNIISGVVYKWVNFGRGWKARWLVLEDGVLSYFKIHGPDKIVVDEEAICRCKIIGLQTPMIVPKVKNVCNGDACGARNPLGEIHLKVSCIRESRSDYKRFSIFTGTKTLHLRAKTREDCLAWLDALRAAKGMFPRMSNSELMAPLDNVQVSTEKLRRKLLEEGVREEVIQESEEIMRSEFTALQHQIVQLRKKQLFLIDMLRKFEVTSSMKARSFSARNSSSTSVSPVLQNCKSMVQHR